jgi:dGTPase
VLVGSEALPIGEVTDMGEQFIRRTRAVRLAAEEDLAAAATRSATSKGRVRQEEPDRYRTDFERDRDRIMHAKAFRRLKHKTSVWLNPEGDHYITRLTHTIQVTQVARALAVGLGLNEALAEAIALGHDVGHSPFGHTGEDALEPYFEGGWHHAAQSVRVFEVLEDLNLTWEVRDGIRAHSWRIDPPPGTPEGHCVRFADRIAYLSHDVLDAVRAGVLREDQLPASTGRTFGRAGSQMIGAMIEAVIDHSVTTGAVSMAPDQLAAMHELRDFMFAAVYFAPHQEDKKRMAIQVIRQLVDHHLRHPEDLPPVFRETDDDLLVQVVDYVAGMTDRYALSVHDRLFRPRLF